MKLKSFFLAVALVVAGCGIVRGQVTEHLNLGFEAGETGGYTVTPASAATMNTALHASGQRSLALTQQASGNVEFEIGPIDFTQTEGNIYIALLFDHICMVSANGLYNNQGRLIRDTTCTVWYKKGTATTWTRLPASYYDRTSPLGYSANFTTLNSFNSGSYDSWAGGTATNDLWRGERFNGNSAAQFIIGQSSVGAERTLSFKIVMQAPKSGNTAGTWYLDNVKVVSSVQPMVRPSITMVRYPDYRNYPNTRVARVVLDAASSYGINADSVSLFWRAGSDSEVHKVKMNAVSGVENRYAAAIPFNGYDTVMRFYCTARDATNNINANYNRTRFPAADGVWQEFCFVRGGEDQPGEETAPLVGTSNESDFPFASFADNKSEWVYDSALMAAAGYGPGGITKMRFKVGSNSQAWSRGRVQLKLKNVDADYMPPTSTNRSYPFTSSFMQVVYDGALSVPTSTSGATIEIPFTDTFYYAGKDLIMQMTYDGEADGSAITVKAISASVKKSIRTNFGEASMNYDPFTSSQFATGDVQPSTKPAIVMTEYAPLPLLYDLGISELVTPTFTVPMSERPGSVVVKLKNHGAQPINAVRITYAIDDTLIGHYDWTGPLAVGGEQEVTVTSSVDIVPGFHSVRVWVEDTLTASAGRFRDHEPLNDTVFTEFIVCEGPMSGVRNIGGPQPDFNTIDELLFTLSRCGMADSLIVRLASGAYTPFALPSFNGLEGDAYMVFEPQEGADVEFYSSTAASSIINISTAKHVRFRDVKFVRRAATLTTMIGMSAATTDVRFSGCTFVDSLSNPSASMRIGTLLNSAGADSIMVEGCTFIGGKIGITLHGQNATAMSHHATVCNTRFEEQYDNAISARFQHDLVVERNEMYSTLSSANVLLLYECSGATRVVKNRIYAAGGAGAIGASRMTGTETTPILIANNMVVSDYAGSSNLSGAVAVSGATWTDVVYNSVKLEAPRRTGVAAVTFGSGVTNSRFVNNVVVCLDGGNYAFNYLPGADTTNTVGYNDYYAMGSVLNKLNNVSYASLSSWRMALAADSASVSVDPNFLNGSRVDLRTYNRMIKGVGTPLTTVSDDIFDSVRSATAPCPGAFEFSSLFYDFEVESMLSPVTESCRMPDSSDLVLVIRNSGINAYNGMGLTLGYQINNDDTVRVAVTQQLRADDIDTLYSGVKLSLPPAGKQDATYHLTTWVEFASDPNQTNDTNRFTIISHVSPSTPANDSVWVPYATPAIIAPTVGVDLWPVYGDTTAPQRPSQLLWYRDSTDTEPFYVGHSLATDTLRQGVQYFFRQRRAMPLVRITQVEIAHGNSTVGVTPNAPYWLVSGRKVALQLTNIGDDTAYLAGDTLQSIGTTTGLNNKTYVFSTERIAPGESIVVQFATGSSANEQLTTHTGAPLANVSASYNTKIGFVYRRGGVIEDAVAFNGITTDQSRTDVNWPNINVPAYVWSGDGVNTSNSSTTAGIYRTAFNGGAADWTIATAAQPMFLAATDPSWVRYTDNGCEGDLAKAVVTVQAPPAADLDLLAPQLPTPACGMSTTPVTVTVRNYGTDTVENPTFRYLAGDGDTVTETYMGKIAGSGGSITFTFSQELNMVYDRDTMFVVKVWADSVSDDRVHSNDTVSAITGSLYTPPAAPALEGQTVDYATSAVLTHHPAHSGVVPVWYDYDLLPVDTAFTHTTEILYAGGTMGMSYVVVDTLPALVGTDDNVSSKTEFPNPYQAKSKYVKEQYIYSAADLYAAGAKRGPISELSFYLDSLYGVESLTFDTYRISMALTDDTVFSSKTAWKDVTSVFYRSNFTLNRNDAPWVKHVLDEEFVWDGHSSIVVQVTRSISTVHSAGVQTRFTSKSNTVLYKQSNTALSPSLESFNGTGMQSEKRPNIAFNNQVIFGCSGPMTPFNLQLVNVPEVDMAMMWPSGSLDEVYSTCEPVTLNVNLRNQGSQPQEGVKIYYYLDTLAVDSTTVTGTIAAGQLRTVALMSRDLTPGRHTVMAIVSIAGDNVASNDTVRRSLLVRFCGGNYTVAPTGAQYTSVAEAVDSLNIAGITGPVTFQIAPATYEGQVKMDSVYGSSITNTVTFVGGDGVVLMAPTSQAANYVFSAEGVSNLMLSDLTIIARPASGNYANALVVGDGSNVTVSGCTLRAKGTVVNAGASSVVLNGPLTNFVFHNNTMDSGYYGMVTVGTGFADVVVDSNHIVNFSKMGLMLRGVNNLNIASNEVFSSRNEDSRGLNGIYLSQITGNIDVRKNKIYIVGEKKGGMSGLLLENVAGTIDRQAFVANNMISCSSTNTAGMQPSGIKPSGIWIDSTSAFVNVFFNSIRLDCGTYTGTQGADKSYAFYSGNTNSDLQVKNNIFANLSKGYAYYVSELNTVVVSDYNAYYTESAKPFAWKVTNLASLAALQNANSGDANSVLDEPYFVSPTDLHLLMTNYVGRGQYSSDVPDDIDGKEREAITGPTIGAHEMEQSTHDMSVVRVVKPVLGDAAHIETDPVLVQAQFYNNGRATETAVSWYAYMEGHEEVSHTRTKTLASFNPGQMRTDTAYLPTPIGVVDTQTVHIVVLVADDADSSNNDVTAKIFLKPAFNLSVDKMATTVPSSGGCEQRDVTIKITLKNVGEKEFPANTPFTIGYHTEVSSPANLTIANIGATVEETATLTTALARNRTTTLEFAQHANLYPTDTSVDIEVRVTGWYHYQHDLKPDNDSALVSSKWAIAKSNYTPHSPIGHDTTLAYATWGAVRAEQENGWAINWYRDTTANPFYHPSGYAASTLWSNTPQYFHDSTYYLRSKTSKGCWSRFSPVTVHVSAPATNDMAMVDVLSPLGNRVYMENDTVRVRVANYSSTTQTNIPVTYQLKKGNNVRQTVTEVINATLQRNEVYTYTFTTLLDSINTPTTQQNYTLNVWTDKVGDASHRNDTLRSVYTFKTLAESRYNVTKPSNLGFDITRLSFNEIDLDLPPLGRGYTNMADYSNPEYPVLHVQHGMTDTMIIQLTPFDATEQSFRCKVGVYIDFDRSGNFTQTGENVVPSTTFYSNETVKVPITIASTSEQGYMRMRVVVTDYGENMSPTVTNDAHIIDFLLFVDAVPATTDLAVMQIVSPRDYLIRDDEPKVVTFRVGNKGTQALQGATFHYRFTTEEGVFDSTLVWTGALPAGNSKLVSLPAFSFPYGVTTLAVWPQVQNDQNRSNDTLVYEYNRFHIVTLDLDDNFDNSINYWYAPTGYNAYSYNYWECGTPTTTKLNAAHSTPNAWVTDLDAPVVSGKRGNVSYLYSPIIDISQVRPDTLSFMLRRNLTGNSSLHLEFYNFQNQWVKADSDSATNWYNDEENRVFNGSTSGNGYDRYWMATSRISGDFPERVQFRFVYTTPMGSNNNTAFGEGCAIDDFRIGRARRQVDGGVIAIVHPDSCRYGETIYPKVVVKNFGYDTLRSLNMGYTVYGDHMARLSSMRCLMAPDEVDTFTFAIPFTITTEFPDTFYIQAYTILPSDIYFDNDTTERMYHMLPLDNDISAQEIIAPSDRVLAGDDAVAVTVRMRNFGSHPIHTVYASYLVNDRNRVDEVVNFDTLMGKPLESMEYYNYTFRQKFHAGMGVIRITAIVKDGINQYPYNDTVTRSVEGISSVTDLAASSMVLSEVNGRVRVEVVVENVGARGVGSFEVGYMIDGNPSTRHVEYYEGERPLAVLSRMSYVFETTLARRSGGYQNIVAFVTADDDNDSSNDTTDVVQQPFYDLAVMNVTVQENAEETCRTFIFLRNEGNTSVVNQNVTLSAVVNGEQLSLTTRITIPTGETRYYEFPTRIAKSASRTYSGTGSVAYGDDDNPQNNQTSDVRVVNLIGISDVDSWSALVLEQNYPNPFSLQTTISVVMPEAADVRFFVVDLMGHMLVDRTLHLDEGRSSFALDLSGYPAGVYYYGISVRGERRMRKLIVR